MVCDRSRLRSRQGRCWLLDLLVLEIAVIPVRKIGREKPNLWESVHSSSSLSIVYPRFCQARPAPYRNLRQLLDQQSPLEYSTHPLPLSRTAASVVHTPPGLLL